MIEAKFTSFTTCDFLNDFDLDVFIDAIEKSAPIWVKEMKSRGLLLRSLNRVWNQNDVHRLVMSYEYESKKAYLKNREYIEDAFRKNEAFRKIRPTAKFTTSRCIVLMEVLPKIFRQY